MAYRAEYHREVRDEEPKQSGWKSWFGLGDNKDRDEDRDRGYNYQSTTTYRTNPQQSSFGGYERERYPERIGTTGQYSSGHTGTRGGYGYTSSDEVTRPSWNTDRDYQTRSSYGQPSGDRDQQYYSKETRTYGGDRDQYSSQRTGGDYHRGQYGFSGEQSYSRDYPSTRDYSSTTQRDYPTRGGDYSRDYTTTSRDYTTGGRYQGVTGGDSYPSYGQGQSRGGYGFERDTTYTSGRSQPETSSRGYGYESRRGEQTYGGDSYTTRPSYQQSSYRY